jgi:stage II sporulation protein M
MKNIRRIKEKKIYGLQLQLVVFIIFVIIGSLYANSTVKHNANNYKIVFDMFSNKISNANILRTDLFQFIVIKRLQIFLLIWIIGFTFFSVYVNSIITGYLGLCFGILFCAGLIYNSYKGYLLVLLLLFPQYIIYVPIYILLISRSTDMSRLIYSSRKITKNFKNNKKRILDYIMILIICILFVIFGSLMEVYINTNIIKWYLNK